MSELKTRPLGIKIRESGEVEALQEENESLKKELKDCYKLRFRFIDDQVVVISEKDKEIESLRSKVKFLDNELVSLVQPEGDYSWSGLLAIVASWKRERDEWKRRTQTMWHEISEHAWVMVCQNDPTAEKWEKEFADHE